MYTKLTTTDTPRSQGGCKHESKHAGVHLERKAHVSFDTVSRVLQEQAQAAVNVRVDITEVL